MKTHMTTAAVCAATTLLLLLLLLPSPVASASTGASQHHQRQLALDCPVLPPTEYDDEPLASRFRDYSKGKLGRKLVEKVRGTNPTAFYQNLLDDLTMASCDQSLQALPRCVEEYSPDAATDELGACLEAADTDCIDGFCERAPNCYWGPIEANQRRTTRFPPEHYEGARDRLINPTNPDSYVRDLAFKFVLPGLSIGVVTLLFWTIFLISRYCCCCLWNRCGRLCSFCSPVPRRGGYKKKCRQIGLPALLYILSLIAVVIAGALAYVGNDDVTSGVTTAFYHTSGLIDDFSRFLDRGRVPLINTQFLIDDAAADASSIFAGTSYVRSTALAIVDSLSDFADIHLDGLDASGAQDTFDSAIGSFEGQVEPVVDSVESMLDALEIDLNGNVDVIQSAVTSVIDQIDSVNGQSQEWQDQVHSLESQEISLRTYRKLGVMIVFLTGLIATVAGSISILTSKCNKCQSMSKLINIAGILCAVLGSLTFIVASVSLVVSVVWNDACQIADILTTTPSSLEPLVGEHVVTITNAIFNDINLADAFNVSEKLDFQSKLDEGMSSLGDVNITALFDQVIEPLDSIQDAIDSISATALAAINQGTTLSNGQCPFSTEYSTDDILEPWYGNTGKGTTAWLSKSTGSAIDYSRIANETAAEYFDRLYGDVAGVCAASDDCCLQGNCAKIVGDVCNGGGDCLYPCEELGNAIITGYATYTDLYDLQLGMSADLGIICPAEATSCPTPDFAAAGHNQTVVDLIVDFQSNITMTANSLVNLATTSVGDIMIEVQDLLCNMNISFVKQRYERIEQSVCRQTLGGVASVNWALWALAVFLSVSAILANVLAVRLNARGKGDWIAEDEAISAMPY